MLPPIPLFMTTVLALAQGQALLQTNEDDASEGSSRASVETSADMDVRADSSAKTEGTNGLADETARARSSSKTPWIHRYPEEKNLIGMGVMSGVYLPSARHELFESNTMVGTDQGFEPFAAVAPTIGARFSYLPLSFLGAELEGAVMPTQTEEGDSATLWTVRGGLLGQLPTWSIVPFVTLGAGMLAVTSEPNAVGKDVDPALYFGGGAKFNLTGRTQLRVDLRDVVSHKRSRADTFEGHNVEALLSFSVVLGRDVEPKPLPPSVPVDSDGDGFIDDQDACPNEKGVAPDGCRVRDRDGDGYADSEDRCPDEAGVHPDGCPIRDSDGDGFDDPVDVCPNEAGVQPDGCPIRDTDFDGFLDDDDMCPQEPEDLNGYDDQDGCPDEIPEEVKEYIGLIKGIQFAKGKSTLGKKARVLLDDAATVLTEHYSVRLEISAHTDDRGERESNVELSQARADAIREYLVSKGIDAERLQARGAGPDEPIADNADKQGRAENRRIEFKILK